MGRYLHDDEPARLSVQTVSLRSAATRSLLPGMPRVERLEDPLRGGAGEKRRRGRVGPISRTAFPM